MLREKMNKKLISEKGTSIFFGLLLFLVASVVSIVILNGAVTTVKRVESDRKAEQNYLICSSAARMIRDAIENTSIKWEKKITLDESGNQTGDSVITWSGNYLNSTSSSNDFPTFLKNYIEDFYNIEVAVQPYTKTFTVSVPSGLVGEESQVCEVTAALTIKKTENEEETTHSGFDISVLFTAGTGYDICQMVLTLSGKVSSEITETMGENRTKVTYVTYTWDASDIFYGDNERNVAE